MGRGLIIFIVGMFIVMGIYNFSSQNRLLSSSEDMVQQVHYTMASNTALSAIEMAGQAIVMNSSEKFRQDNDIWTVELPDGNASVLLNRTGNDIRLTSTATTEGVTATVIGDYRLQVDGNMPPLDAALGFYSKSLKFDTKGNSFIISGCDHAPGETSSSDCDDIYGIAVNDGANESIIEAGLPGNRGDNVTGQGGTPSIGVVDNDGKFIDDAVEYFSSIADLILDDYLMVDDKTLGTSANPQVVRVRDGGELRVANAQGAGVIIIEPGATLDVRGTFTYEGLIIVQGVADLTRGNMHLYGGMLFGGEEPELQIYESELELTGNINIRYSSIVMEYLDEYFSSNSANRRLVLLQQFQ